MTTEWLPKTQFMSTSEYDRLVSLALKTPYSFNSRFMVIHSLLNKLRPFLTIDYKDDIHYLCADMIRYLDYDGPCMVEFMGSEEPIRCFPMASVKEIDAMSPTTTPIGIIALPCPVSLLDKYPLAVLRSLVIETFSWLDVFDLEDKNDDPELEIRPNPDHVIKGVCENSYADWKYIPDELKDAFSWAKPLAPDDLYDKIGIDPVFSYLD